MSMANNLLGILMPLNCNLQISFKLKYLWVCGEFSKCVSVSILPLDQWFQNQEIYCNFPVSQEFCVQSGCANRFCFAGLAAVLLGTLLIPSLLPQERNSMAMLSKFLLQPEDLNSWEEVEVAGVEVGLKAVESLFLQLNVFYYDWCIQEKLTLKQWFIKYMGLWDSARKGSNKDWTQLSKLQSVISSASTEFMLSFRTGKSPDLLSALLLKRKCNRDVEL